MSFQPEIYLSIYVYDDYVTQGHTSSADVDGLRDAAAFRRVAAENGQLGQKEVEK